MKLLKDLVASWSSVAVRLAVVFGCTVLVVARYSIGFKINDGLPPLIEAASQADQAKVLKLLEAGYFVDQSDAEFNVALHYAVMLADNHNSITVFKELLKNYASTCQRNNKGAVPLDNVGEIDNYTNRMYIVRSLILHGANIHSRDNSGLGVLERIIELIDNRGLQIMLTDWGWLFTPDDIAHALERAKYYNNGFTVRTMEEFRSKDSLKANTNNFNDLVMAILSHDIKKMNDAIQKDPQSINAALPEFRFTPLHLAVVQPEEYALPLVTLLIKNNANIGLKDYRGATALLMLMHNASDVQKKQLVTYLVKHGADINTQDNNKDTILHLAVKKNDDTLVQFLITSYPHLDKYKKNAQGKTPKDLARELNYGSMYKMLR